MSIGNSFTDAYAAKRPLSAQWFKRAQAVLGGAVGHDLRYFEPMPLYIERGAGGRKWDVDGNEYIDFLGGNGALLLGHAAPEIVTAINDTVGRGTHFGNDHPLHIEWGELVQRLIPSAERVRFVNSGTSGRNALKYFKILPTEEVKVLCIAKISTLSFFPIFCNKASY